MLLFQSTGERKEDNQKNHESHSKVGAAFVHVKKTQSQYKMRNKKRCYKAKDDPPKPGAVFVVVAMLVVFLIFFLFLLQIPL